MRPLKLWTQQRLLNSARQTLSSHLKWPPNRCSSVSRCPSLQRSLGSMADVPGSSSSTSGSALDQEESLQRCVTVQGLNSIDGLKAWLEERMPGGQLQAWGKEPGTKSLASLWAELATGEACLLESRPPRRTVRVVCVQVKHASTGKFLVEASQMLLDGSTRVRNRPLSEKMKPGETIEEAALRGLREELGSDLGCPSRVALLTNTIETNVEDRESLSYPGLSSVYTLHSITAVVQGLPEEAFSTDENEETFHKLGGNGTFTMEASANPHGIGENGSARVGNENFSGVKVHFWEWMDNVPPAA